MSDGPFTRVAKLDEVPPGTIIEVEFGGEPYAICNVDGHVRALFGECPHEGGPLGQGVLEGPLISCPWHCWQFDSLTGVCIMGDDVVLETYPVKIEGGDILVQLPMPKNA
jgi:nitrite reductase/ring-hydroxylating ferredoxin subunit